MSKVVSRVCAALAPLACVAAGAFAQPMFWSGNGHYYEITTGDLTWNEALTDAASASWLGVTGHLVTVTSAEENLFLTMAFGASELDGKWLGGFQQPGAKEPGEGWTWITGEAFSFLGWSPGEPNNFGFEDSIIFAHPEEAWGKPWNDAEGAIPSNGYVVEFDVPAPGALALAAVGALVASRRRSGSAHGADRPERSRV